MDLKLILKLKLMSNLKLILNLKLIFTEPSIEYKTNIFSSIRRCSSTYGHCTLMKENGKSPTYSTRKGFSTNPAK